MSIKAESTSIACFPEQQAIMNYIRNHHSIRDCLETDIIKEKAPDSVEKVAKFFADKQMFRRKIEQNLETLFPSEEFNKPNPLESAILRTKAVSNIHQTVRNNLENESKTYSTLLVGIYKICLEDLIDGKMFKPPSSEEMKNGITAWTQISPVNDPNQD